MKPQRGWTNGQIRTFGKAEAGLVPFTPERRAHGSLEKTGNGSRHLLQG